MEKFETLIKKLKKKPNQDLLIAIIILLIHDKVGKKNKTKAELKKFCKSVLSLEEDEFNSVFAIKE